MPSGSTKNAFPQHSIVSSLVHWASMILQKHGIETPRFDAEVILSRLLGCNRIDLYVNPGKPVEDATAEAYKEAILKRTQRVPLQYITHHAEFLSLDFYVDERALIPRPETELLVEAVIQRSKAFANEREIVIVDIGTGSGNISVALAVKIPNARIFAVDVSPDALAVAKINAQRHRVSDKITFLCGDTFQPLEGYGIESPAHFIVSNPPYIAFHELGSLQEEVRNFEPHVALATGKDGLSIFRGIIPSASAWLKPGGFIVLEVGEKQARKVSRLLEETGHFKKAELIKDYQHIHRIVVAQKEEHRG